MNKSIKIIIGLVGILALFSGCSVLSKTDQYGWYHDYAAAKTVAKKQGKNILFVMSADDSDSDSATLKSTIFNTKKFKRLVSDQYILCNLDFSRSEFQKGKVPDTASEKQKKIAKAAAEKFKNNNKIAASYNIQKTPFIVLITKDGYFITEIKYNKDIKTPKQFLDAINKQQKKIDSVQKFVDTIENSKGVDRVKAIDAMYEATEAPYRYLLSDKIREVPNLDTNDKSGLLSKYTFEIANMDVMDAYFSHHMEKAPDIYVAAAESGKLSPLYKQKAYYKAGYLLGSIGSSDYDKIMDYLQKSCDADPESEAIPTLKKLMKVVQQMKMKAAVSDKESAAKKTEVK